MTLTMASEDVAGGGLGNTTSPVLSTGDVASSEGP